MNPELTHPESRDPIAELVEVLAETGRPPDGWIDRWSVDGYPVEAAWNVSIDPGAMRDLLRMARYPDMQTVEAIASEASHGGSSRAGTAADIRRAVPRPPPLDEILLSIGATTRG